VVIVAVPWEGHKPTPCWSRCARAAGREDRGGLREPAGVRQEAAPTRCRFPRGAPPSRRPRLLPDSPGWWRPSTTCRPSACCRTSDVAEVDLDVLVLGDDREATDVVRELAGTDRRGARRLRRPAAQRPPGRGVHRQPDRHQPALQGARRACASRTCRPALEFQHSDRRGGGAPVGIELPEEAARWSDYERECADALLDGHTIVVNVRKNGPHKHLVPWLQQQGLLVYVGHAGNRHSWAAVRVRQSLRAGSQDGPGGDGPALRGVADQQPELLEKLRRGELTGRALGCWCAPEPCHADVLARRAG
jgi:hypothetical protein